MNLTHLFDLSLTGRRDQTALEWRGRTYTAVAFVLGIALLPLAVETAGQELPV